MTRRAAVLGRMAGGRLRVVGRAHVPIRPSPTGARRGRGGSDLPENPGQGTRMDRLGQQPPPWAGRPGVLARSGQLRPPWTGRPRVLARSGQQPPPWAGRPGVLARSGQSGPVWRLRSAPVARSRLRLAHSSPGEPPPGPICALDPARPVRRPPGGPGSPRPGHGQQRGRRRPGRPRWTPAEADVCPSGHRSGRTGPAPAIARPSGASIAPPRACPRSPPPLASSTYPRSSFRARCSSCIIPIAAGLSS